jgi:hypothetical protein
MKMGEETICYQHHQATTILEKLLKKYTSYPSSELKEAIEWITKANDSAVRMEDKLKEYKQENAQLKHQLHIVDETIKRYQVQENDNNN